MTKKFLDFFVTLGTARLSGKFKYIVFFKIGLVFLAGEQFEQNWVMGVLGSKIWVMAYKRLTSPDLASQPSFSEHDVEHLFDYCAQARELTKKAKLTPNTAIFGDDSCSSALQVESCLTCRNMLPSLQKEPLNCTESDTPMSDLSVELFELAGHHFIVMVDRY